MCVCVCVRAGNSTGSCASVRQELGMALLQLSSAEHRCSSTLRECALDLAQQEKRLKVRDSVSECEGQ